MSKPTTNQSRMSRHSRLVKLAPGWLLALSVVLLMAQVTLAEDNAGTTPSPTPVPLSVQEVMTYTKIPNEAGMGDWIAVVVKNLSEAIAKDNLNPRDLVLYLDGRGLKGVNASPIEDPGSNKLAFQLKRTDDSREAWSTLLGRPSLKSHLREVTVSVGLPDKQAVPFADPKKPKINLRVYHPYWAIFALLGLLLTIGLFVYLARTTRIIRDSNPPQLPPNERPYSLALSQAAWWFFLVVGSFIFIYLITGDYNTITEQALILIGIGTGTALGSAMIDATKRDTADNELHSLEPEKAKLEAEVNELKTKVSGIAGAETAEEKQALADANVELKEKLAQLKATDEKITVAKSGLAKPVSEGFRRDLLTDINGINFHRFQTVVWTIVLGILFCIGVYKELAMPAFSGTLLALMGISAGTYLGFKIPEKQN